MTADQQVRLYEPLCRAVASRYYAPGLDRDDLLQEARFGVVKGLRDYRPGRGANLNTFVEVCAERQVITAVKTAQRHKHGPLNQAVTAQQDDDGQWVDALDLIPAGVEPHDTVVLRDELRELLFRIDFDLTDLEREAVIRHAIRGEPYAGRGGKDKRVDNALQRARRKLAA